jgi:regulator of replication initiation timing
MQKCGRQFSTRSVGKRPYWVIFRSKIQVEQECCDLKENVETLANENRLMEEKNAKLRREIENLSAVKKVYF